jgi:hypothetical protein
MSQRDRVRSAVAPVAQAIKTAVATASSLTGNASDAFSRAQAPFASRRHGSALTDVPALRATAARSAHPVGDAAASETLAGGSVTADPSDGWSGDQSLFVTASSTGPSTGATEQAAAATDTGVYSAEDQDVQPPELLSSPMLRQAISGAPAQTNTLEMVVSALGTVERVRLITPLRRIPDVMLIGPAKTWEFRPALKDGRPVRYRLTMSWLVDP